MTSQLVIFRAFLFIFFRSPDPRSEFFFPVNQLINKFWPYFIKLYGKFHWSTKGNLKWVYLTCADPEFYQRGSNFVQFVFPNKYHYKRAIIDLPVKRLLNGVLLAGGYCPKFNAGLVAL